MTTTPTVEGYIQNIKNFPTPLDRYREQGLDAFQVQGIPHTKQEDWRYTSLSSFLPDQLRPAPKASETIPRFPHPLDQGILFANGHHQQECDRLPAGVSITTNRPRLAWETPQPDAFEALNMATLPSVVTLEIAPNESIDATLCLSHVITPSGMGSFMSPHLEIVVGAGSRITLLELFSHTEDVDQAYHHNSLTKIQLNENAHLEHIKVVLESPQALHVGKLQAHLAAHARLTGSTFSLSGGLVRNNIHLELNGEEAFADTKGLYAVNGSQHHDNFTLVHHKQKNTHSRQLYKGILDDRARGVFTGKIVVARRCPGVDSRLLNKNLLLTPKAHADTRPQLEVYTDDVQCSHGATTGQMSPEELFYLESRGIPQSTAQKILCHAFSEEIIQSNSNFFIRQMLDRILYNNFERHHFGNKPA